MVFVTVGNGKQGFARLLAAVDVLTGEGFFQSEPVLLQIGHTEHFRPRHCDWRTFLNREEFGRTLSGAALVICHGGMTQLEAVRMGKLPVVMPRRHRYGEHVNDHQIELTETLAAGGYVVSAHEPDDLPAAIRAARSRQPKAFTPSPMIDLVAAAVNELCRRDR